MATPAAYRREESLKHFNGMILLADMLGISLKHSKDFMGYSRENWLARATQDANLNNVTLDRFDMLAFNIKRQMARLSEAQRVTLREAGIPFWSLSLGASLYKELIYRDILGFTPEQRADWYERAHDLPGTIYRCQPEYTVAAYERR